MTAETHYISIDLQREAVDQFDGTTLLDFGANWCGYCKAAQPLVDAALAGHSQLRHLKIEDGPGRRLGRSFGVKLWPTLIFLRQGREIARLVRPAEVVALRQALEQLEGLPE